MPLGREAHSHGMCPPRCVPTAARHESTGSCRRCDLKIASWSGSLERLVEAATCPARDLCTTSRTARHLPLRTRETQHLQTGASRGLVRADQEQTGNGAGAAASVGLVVSWVVGITVWATDLVVVGSGSWSMAVGGRRGCGGRPRAALW